MSETYECLSLEQFTFGSALILQSAADNRRYAK